MISPTVLVLIPIAVAALSLAFLVPIVRNLYRRCDVDEITSEWLDDFSPACYYPMRRLLADEDFRFLSRQPGFDLSLYKKLRQERLYIFRQYLSRMVVDFNRLHMAARLILARGNEDQSHLVTQLIWLKVKFSFAVIHAEFSYLLCSAGCETLAVRATILRLEEMSFQFNSLSAPRVA